MREQVLFVCVVLTIILVVLPMSASAYYAEVTDFHQYKPGWGVAGGPFSYTRYNYLAPSTISISVLQPGNGVRFTPADVPFIYTSNQRYAAAGLYYAGDVYDFVSFDADVYLPSTLRLELWCYQNDLDYLEQAIMTWHSTSNGVASLDIPTGNSWQWEFRVAVVPEPSSLAVLVAGMGSLTGLAWSIKKRIR